MLCNKCGQQLPENVKFCNACGASISTVPANSANAESSQAQPQNLTNNETSQMNNLQNTASQKEEPVFASPSFNTEPSDDKKTKGKWGAKKILAVALPVLVAILVFFSWDAIAGFCIKTFGSDSDYFLYVESKNISESLDDASTFLSAFSRDPKQSVTTKVNCNLSDEAVSLLSLAGLGSKAEDLQWFNDVTFTTNSAFDGKKLQFGLSTEAKGNDIFSGDFVLDLESMKAYINLPEMNKKILALDFSNSGASLASSPAKASALLLDMKDLVAEMEMGEMFEKYLETALKTIDTVSASEEVIKVDNIQQECTVLELVVDYDLLLNMAEAVLNEAKSDEKITDFAVAYFNLIKKTFSDEANFEDIDIEKELSDGIDDLLDDLDKLKSRLRGDKELFTLYDYVVDHRVVGRKFVVNGNEVFRYMTLHDGDKFASEFIFGEVFFINGSGTDDGNKCNASYSFVTAFPYEETEIFTIDVSNLDKEAFEDGLLCGEFKITPSKATLNQLHPMASSLKPSFEIICNQTEDSSALDLTIYAANDSLFSISFDSNFKEDPSIKIPSGKKINVDDDEDVHEWEEDLDLDDIEDALNDSDAPDFILAILDELQREINRSSSYSPYYY